MNGEIFAIEREIAARIEVDKRLSGDGRDFTGTLFFKVEFEKGVPKKIDRHEPTDFHITATQADTPLGRVEIQGARHPDAKRRSTTHRGNPTA